MHRINRFTYILFAIGYGLFLYLIYHRTGIVTINEAEKYISSADALLNGDLAGSIQQHLFYSSYVCFVALFKLTGGITMVVIAQAILSFFSAICVKKTIELISGKSNFSILGMAIFLFSYPLQYWTLTLFSDSFFVSIIAITFFYTVKEKSGKELLLWILLNLILIAARPPGIFLSLLFVLYFLSAEKIMAAKKTVLPGTVLFLILLISMFNLPVETKGYIRPIAAGAVIIDQPDYNIPVFSTEKSTMLAAYNYLYTQYGPGHIAMLYGKKMLSFFTLTRPYYSNLNNLILSFHYFLYFFAIAGLVLLKRQKKTQLILLFLLAVFCTANLVGLTYNEWHYRFTLAIFPFLIILSATGLQYLYNFSVKLFFSKKPS